MDDKQKELLNDAEQDLFLTYRSFLDVGVLGMIGGVAYSTYGNLSGNKEAMMDGSRLNYAALLLTANVFLAKGIYRLAKHVLQKKSGLEKKLDD